MRKTLNLSRLIDIEDERKSSNKLEGFEKELNGPVTSKSEVSIFRLQASSKRFAPGFNVRILFQNLILTMASLQNAEATNPTVITVPVPESRVAPTSGAQEEGSEEEDGPYLECTNVPQVEAQVERPRQVVHNGIGSTSATESVMGHRVAV